MISMKELINANGDIRVLMENMITSLLAEGVSASYHDEEITLLKGQDSETCSSQDTLKALLQGKYRAFFKKRS